MAAVMVLCTAGSGISAATDDAGDNDLPIPAPMRVETSHKGIFGGVRTEYKAIVSNLSLKNEAGEVYADAVTTAYISERQPGRPVTFVFNGGPGSSSIWLHMGLVGPKRVVVPSDAEDPGLAPYRVVDNEHSLIGVSDVVMIDPIGTGYSRLAGKGAPEDVYGLAEDARTVAQIIREWVRANNRWNTPVYILGESFGTTRAAAMLPYLEGGAEPLRVNGLILISQALDYTGSSPFPDNFVAYVTYLPTEAATAWYHGKVAKQGSLEDYLQEVRAFAVGEYLPALFKGSSLGKDELERVAGKLAGYLGLDVGYVKRANLRVLGGRFVKELLRDKGLAVGRLDSRYVLDEIDDTADGPRTDAASAAISGPYSAAFHSYMRNDLGVELDRPYYVSGPEVGREWVWVREPEGYYEPEYVNTAPDLAESMRSNASLRVMVASGYYDFATPFFDAEYTFWRHGIDMSRVTMTYYEAGHMMYLHQPSLEAVARDIKAFIAGE
ncbi:S10 family peptidase [Kordiimonas sp.]|uniref:S10 family peptidase n=1 Tax=Kordiimonas sp. TaxID=1970157 RepID=UPI003A956E04